MADGVVTVEIEFNDENSFHTSYNVNKYPEHARKVQAALRSHFTAEGLDHSILLNPGPGDGYQQFFNCRSWYSSVRDPGERVRYPRLGAFEIHVQYPVGLCDWLPRGRIQVWSKLRSHRWPDPTRLASDVTKLAVSSQQNEDVSSVLKRLRSGGSGAVVPRLCGDLSASCRSSRSAERQPPMFFGTGLRGRVSTPVEARTPRSACSKSTATTEYTRTQRQSMAIPRVQSRPGSATPRSLSSMASVIHQISLIDEMSLRPSRADTGNGEIEDAASAVTDDPVLPLQVPPAMAAADADPHDGGGDDECGLNTETGAAAAAPAPGGEDALPVTEPQEAEASEQALALDPAAHPQHGVTDVASSSPAPGLAAPETAPAPPAPETAASPAPAANELQDYGDEEFDDTEPFESDDETEAAASAAPAPAGKGRSPQAPAESQGFDEDDDFENYEDEEFESEG